MSYLLSNLRSTKQLPIPTKLAVAAVSLTFGLLGACCFRASIAPQDAIAAAPSAAESLFLRRYSPAAHRVSPRLNPSDTVAVVPPPFVTAEVKKYAAVFQPTEQPEKSPVELPVDLPPLPSTEIATNTVASLPIPDWGSSNGLDLGAALLPTQEKPVQEVPVKDSSVFSPPPVPPAAIPAPPREQKIARSDNTRNKSTVSGNTGSENSGLVSIATLPMTTLPAPRVASRYPSSPSGLVPLDALNMPRANSGGAGDSAIVPIPHLSPYAE